MLTVGLDIGSTTVKAVVIDQDNRIVWKRYERHRTRQLEKADQILRDIREELGEPGFRLFTTGSGGGALARILGVKQHQEVNALSEAVEHLHPDPGSVFELGGQDAKYILWRDGADRFCSMNDRCAGGTGATIDRIVMKLCLGQEQVRSLGYRPELVHPVAAKCGVFAETDINSLQKQGIGVESLMISLFHAVVEQNLTVLTRGHVPSPPVLLLGGPNVYFPALRECWEVRLRSLWEERGLSPPSAESVPREAPGPETGPGEEPGSGPDPVQVPPDALYYGALGAALLGRRRNGDDSVLRDFEILRATLRRRSAHHVDALPPLFAGQDRAEQFVRRHREAARSPLTPATGAPETETAGVYLGIDGGSTSTKAVLLDREGTVLNTAYRISRGNPVEDVRSLLAELSAPFRGPSGGPRALGVGYTGYAKDLLSRVFGGDTAVVETVAHTAGALHYVPDAEVICDVGGQDIKIIILQNGTVKDFRLNTQCSAGNGFYLQSTAERFGYPVHEFAEAAFSARRIPRFNFGCAVFLEADIVTFQQLGWRPEEIMAGLALVLPQNVWHYVVREPNLGRLGRVFVLQGGTHRNLAVVKAQQDFITARVPDARIHLHPYGEVAGAIGAALEARKRGAHQDPAGSPALSPFVGFDSLDRVRHTVQRDERTRCSLCGNRCQRTFIHVEHGDERSLHILAGCERGQDPGTGGSGRNAGGRTGSDGARGGVPPAGGRAPRPRRAVNFAALSNRRLFSTSESPPAPGRGAGALPLDGLTVGIPRVLNLYTTAPFFSAYFTRLGARVVFSEPTSLQWFARTSGRGCIDPCFPTKVALSHAYQLLCRGDLTHLFFPCIRTLRPEIHTDLHWACAALAAAPEAVKAALTMGADEFAARGVRYLDPVLDMAEWDLLERQLHRALRPMGVSRGRNREAMETARLHGDRVIGSLRERAGEELDRLERERGIGILLLGRPYHLDPGINHGIPEELSARGYPVLTTDALPREGELVRRLFEPEIRDKGMHPLDISDLWARCFSENSSVKLWAARFAARHPNLIAVEISSFRCGHDAPIYSVLDELFAAAGKPYFTFHEMDENRPAGTIRLRVETIDYFLRQYREAMLPCPRSCLVV